MNYMMYNIDSGLFINVWKKHILIFVSFELNCRIYQYRKKETIYENINKVILVLLSMKKLGLQDWLCVTVTIFQIHGIKVKRRSVIFEKIPNCI